MMNLDRKMLISSFLQRQKSQDPTQENVCRSLFGPSDPVLNKKMVEEAIKEDCKTMKAKYNFDFITESPLKGPFAWEKENNIDNIPGYMKTVHHKVLMERIIPVSFSHNDNCDVTNVTSSEKQCTSASGVESSHNTANTSSQASLPSSQETTTSSTEPLTSSQASNTTVTSPLKRKQTSITDYFQCTKKRVSESKRRLNFD